MPGRAQALRFRAWWPLGATALAVVAACSSGGSSSSNSTHTTSSGSGGDGGGGGHLDADALMDPQSCATCHPDHFKEWSGSMHAYASDDPVFVAMNARGQRETNGALGTFCLNCHAPMAVRTGATQNGLDWQDTSLKLRGVTCYFCHSVDAVKGTHDAPLDLASDGVLRGGIQDPTHTSAHASKYSTLHDRDSPDSAKLCGSCHDIVSPLGGHIERTYAEWQGTLFSHGTTTLPCGQCHMDGRQGLAADAPGVGIRRVHGHGFPGVDVALTDFAEADTQKTAIQAALDSALQAELCVKGTEGASGATLQVVIDNVGAGHSWPSGSTQDRRAWVEVIAYQGTQVVYQSGVIPDGQSVVSSTDPDLWLIRDCMFGSDGKQVSMFWDAQSYTSNQLPGPVTNVATDPSFYLTHVVRSFPQATSTPSALSTYPDRVTMRVQLTPIGLDVLDDLIASGDLDPSYKAKMPTYTLAGTVIEWTAAAANIKYLDGGVPVACVSRGLTTGANSGSPGLSHARCDP